MISVLFGNGDGGLIHHATFNPVTYGSVQTIASGDFNNDGNLDLTISYGGVQETRLGQGDGTFIPVFTYGSAISTVYRSTETADFNNDGFLDVAQIGNTGTAYIALGNGDGTFGNRTEISVPAGTLFGISFSDFDGDGSLDVALRSLQGHVYVSLNNGNGTFGAVSSHQVPDNYLGGWGGAYDMASTDLNGDGIADIVSSSQSNYTLSILFGKGSTGVSALQPFTLQTQSAARSTLISFQKVLERIGEQRGHIGAFQSRVEFAINNLKQSSLAYSEASSRITDADVAEDAAKLAANQILQRAAASILGQANLQPSIVLKLLEGI